MKAILAFLALVLAGAILLLVPTLAAPFEATYGRFTVYDCARAVALCSVVAAIAGFLITRNKKYGSYLLNLFLLALFVRIAIGTAIFVFKGQDFFGGDAWTYDFNGYEQMLAWGGDKYAATLSQMFTGNLGSGWGMVYLVAAIYGVVGRNMLAVQFFNSVLGAATAPIVFLCAEEVFRNKRVARLAAIAVAFFPSLVLWSSQGLKDGPTVFALALAILATLKLGQKLSFTYFATLVIALFCVLAFRFYLFYMLLAAIVGAFVVGMRAFTAQSFARQLVVMIFLGLSFTYLGVTRYASVQFEQYGTLEWVQRSRLDAARSAKSGFGQDVDVSTTSGALSAIPMGLVYLFFAPFPWQLGSLRSSITAPEMAIWWASFPLLVAGFWFSIRYRLRQMSPILIFTSMLTLAYSVMQGNVGTAYRQRAQLLIFYFVFVAVGAVLVKEKREERKIRAEQSKRLVMQRRHPHFDPQHRAPQKA